MLKKLFPFVRWFPLTRQGVRADLLAGITVALILVPQSMAYAQLAGLPVVYGLYASFLPVIIASLWGSSNQLHTGPVAMLSLMSAAALIPLASAGTQEFIELSIMLALMVGVLRLALGVFRLGAIVNLLSNPVIVGFTNAAALIIGLSQLSKIIGVPFVRTDSYLADLWGVVHQIPELHWGTVFCAFGAWALIMVLRRVRPSLPGILIAVVATTAISAITGYEKTVTVSLDRVADRDVARSIATYHERGASIAALTETMSRVNQQADEIEAAGGPGAARQSAQLRAEASVEERELGQLKAQQARDRIALHAIRLEAIRQSDGTLQFYRQGTAPAGSELRPGTWRYSAGDGESVSLSAGGAVVGTIPEGLPAFNVPTVDLGLMWALLPAAVVMALIGFMEATSISKAIATSTGDRLDTNKELVGQGLANIVGSFFSSYTVSGSFSRSAVAAKSGAKTGLFAIVSAVTVVLVLLYFTPYLYHLPQAVLAVIVMMAVLSLIRIRPLLHAWKIDRAGAVIGITTFVATLLMAPAIANGIILGVVLTVLYYLASTMRPRAEIVSRKGDGTLGGIRVHRLKPISEFFVPVRFDGSLTFINVAYFEDIILEATARFPKATAILVIGSGINEIDASGEEKIWEITERLKAKGVAIYFSGLKHQVMQVIEKSGLIAELGSDAFFPDKETALSRLEARFGSSRTSAPAASVDDGEGISGHASKT